MSNKLSRNSMSCLLCVCCIVLVAAACSNDDRSIATDTIPDTITDTESGTGPDTGSDTITDTNSGTGPDTGSDTTEDTGETDTVATDSNSDSDSDSVPEAPTLSEASGAYNIATAFIAVNVLGIAPGATVWFVMTTEGSEPNDPDQTSQSLPSGINTISGINQNGTTVIKLRQRSVGGFWSSINRYEFTLDTTAPTIFSFSHDAQGVVCIDSPIHFAVDTGETGGSATVTFNSRTLILGDNGIDGDTTIGDGVYELTYVAAEGDDCESSTVSAAFTDIAGNPASPKDADKTLTIDATGTIVPISISSSTTWNPDGQPYIIETGAFVASSASLTISAGTCVVFRDGAKMIVEGNIQAVGTSDSKITISGGKIELRGQVDRVLTYDEATGAYVHGPRFEHVMASTTDLAILDDIDNSVISGAYMKNCEFNALVGIHPSNWAGSVDGTVYGVYVERSHIGALIGQWQDSRTFDLSPNNSRFINSYFDSVHIAWTGDYSFRNCDIAFIEIYGQTSNGTITDNTIGTLEWYNPRGFTNVSGNNFLPKPGDLAIDISGTSTAAQDVDATGCYWGPEVTAEMISAGSEANISVIDDFYDDIEVAKVLYAGWVTTPISTAGPDW